MNISAINFNIPVLRPLIVRKNSNNGTVTAPAPVLKTLKCDTVSFSGIGGGGDILKKLVPYKVPDMYTGLMMLSQRDLERLQRTGVFKLPLNQMIKVVSHFEDTMLPIDREFFELLKKTSKTQPDITMEDAMIQFFPKHRNKLLDKQTPILQEITRLACDMPKELYYECLELMNITTKRAYNDPVVLPFSEKEFKYKLRRISESIKSKNNRTEVRAINKLIRESKNILNNEPKMRRMFGRNKMSIGKKLEYEMQPHILKRNAENIGKLQDLFEDSPLKKNRDLINLFKTTRAKIHGFPTYAQFERKSFIYELKKITQKLKDKDLAHKMLAKAQTLPTSREDLSAFIVKYAHESNDKIGYSMLMNGLGSIDHLLARSKGGPNKLSNYGLCGAEINRQKTDIYFDEWCRMHPETAKNCQKYVDRLIELCKAGVFEKVSKNKKKYIDKNYIEDFATTIYNISPAENRIKLDISKLYE